MVFLTHDSWWRRAPVVDEATDPSNGAEMISLRPPAAAMAPWVASEVLWATKATMPNSVYPLFASGMLTMGSRARRGPARPVRMPSV